MPSAGFFSKLLVDRNRIESDRSLSYFRALQLSGGIAYAFWWVCVEILLPGSFNPLGSRLAVVAWWFGVYVASFLSDRVAAKLDLWLEGSLWLLTLHYFYLFFFNGADINWVVGTYITVIAASACLHTSRAILAYSIFVVSLSIGLVLYDQTLVRTIFLPGVMTVLAFAYMGIRARGLYEASRETLRMRDEFLSIASHELKTPITSIKLQTQLAQRKIEKGDPAALRPENVRTLIDQTDHQADRLIRIIDEMIDVPKLSTGEISLAFKDIDLSEVAREVANCFAAPLEKAGCALEFETEGAAPIRGDRFRIEQIVANLLSNAIKYGKGKPIRIAVRSSRDQVRLEVIDEGIGIAKKDHRRIFDRFERAVSAKKISGFGLGLFICKHIVDLHHGHIEVESRLGHGSRFIVVLPRRVSLAEAQ